MNLRSLLVCLSLLALALAGCDLNTGVYHDSRPLEQGGSGGTPTGGVTTGGTTTGGTTGVMPPPNTPPVAVVDAYTVSLGSTNNPLNVLANDRDPDGQAITISMASIVSSTPASGAGTVTVSADGLSLRYTPPPNFAGRQTLRYVISDPRGATAEALVTITISAIPLPPAALPDVATLTNDGEAHLLDVLANDLDNAGGGLALIGVSSIATVPPGGEGSFSIVNNRISYTPRAGFTGVETLSYVLRDANGATAVAQALITVLPLAVPPVAVPDVALLDTGSSNNEIDLLANDLDLSGGGLTLTSVTPTLRVPPGTAGTFSVVGNRLRYTPAAGFVGVETATYVVTDANGNTATALVTLTVLAAVPPLPPVALPDVASVASGSSETLLRVLNNDVDASGTGLTITAVTQVATVPPGATAMFSTDGSMVRFAPPAAFTGVVTLQYTIADGNGSTAMAAVAITVTAIALPPTPPVPVPDAAVMAQDSAPVDHHVLANDVDAAAGGLTLSAFAPVQSVPATTHSVSIVNNRLRVQPAAGFAGVIVLSYEVRDVNNSAATSTLTITVTPAAVPPRPVAIPDTATTTAAAGVLRINVISNDIDASGTGLSLASASLTSASLTSGLPPGAGSVAVVNGQVEYTPAALYIGAVVIGYRVVDGNGQGADGTLTVTVLP